MRLARVLGAVGRTFIWLGVLILLFVAYQLWGTGLAHSQAQDDLAQEFEAKLESRPRESGSATANPVTTTTSTPPPPAEDGESIAHLVIPKIGLDEYVVEGVGRTDLQKGPGHYPGTPMPGQEGNAAIAGHRTTYGQPFHNVDKLEEGDEILVTTLQGTFKYEVMETEIVSPSQVEVLDDFDDNRLTLTSCHPKYSAANRIIVTASLADPPAPTPVERIAVPRVQTIDGEDPGGPWGPVILWASITLAIWLVFYFLSRKWRRWPAYALGLAPFAASLFVFYVNLANLLPSNY